MTGKQAVHRERWLTSPGVIFVLTLVLIGILVQFGPEEKALGNGVKVVYLHGAWVWASLVMLLVGGICGLVGLAAHKPAIQRWSRTLGHTGLFFWIGYLPVSLVATQINWNGLFLEEPRWRLALVFAIGGLLLQAGLWLVGSLSWTAAANVGYVILLTLSLRSVQNVMHPNSPIFSSVFQIQVYFGGLFLMLLFAAWQVARWLHSLENRQRTY